MGRKYGTVAATNFFENKTVKILSNDTHSPCHRQAGTPMIISGQQFALLPICVKMFHPQYYLVATAMHISPYCVGCARARVCVRVCVCTVYIDAGRAKGIKNFWTAVFAAYQRNLTACHRFVISVIQLETLTKP
jgi:hypothetical protein